MKRCVLIVLDESSGAKIYYGDGVEVITCYKSIQEETGVITTVVPHGAAEKLCKEAGLIDGIDYVVDRGDSKELA